MQQAGGVFFVIWLLMMLGMVIGYIILLVAVWRAMKAHESIANSVARIERKVRNSDQWPPSKD